MKKFALLFALVLPLVFSSCKKDEEPEETKSFITPYTAWGATQEQVKANFKGFELDVNNSNSNILLYFTNAAEGTLPGYVYLFDSNGLYSSTLCVDEEDGEDLVAWLSKSYREVSEEIGNDEDFVFVDNNDNFVCTVSYDENSDAWMAVWLNNTRSEYNLSEIKAIVSKAIKK